MSFPYYFHIGSVRLHPHPIFEALAYAVAFRLYVSLRGRQGDALSDVNRWSVIAAAAVGAGAGSRLLYWFEDPGFMWWHRDEAAFWLSGKTIVGGLIGGLLAVEFIKSRLGIVRRTGDLFAVPLCVGIAIGRIGCFLSGAEDHTGGVATTLPWGVNFGDGITRHPTQLYEMVFTLLLGIVLWRRLRRPHTQGDIFRAFMVCYFAFRLACDFLKPDVRIIFGLSSIQCACVALLLYYSKDVVRWFGRANGGLRAIDCTAGGISRLEGAAQPGEAAR